MLFDDIITKNGYKEVSGINKEIEPLIIEKLEPSRADALTSAAFFLLRLLRFFPDVFYFILNRSTEILNPEKAPKSVKMKRSEVLASP